MPRTKSENQKANGNFTAMCDPCCGSGGMLVQSEKFVESHDGKRRESYALPLAT